MRPILSVAFPALICSALLVITACAGHEEVKSGYVGTGSMSQDQVMQLLAQNGYQDIDGLHKNGEDWVGSANKDGSPVSFDIDKKGAIHSK
jgi:hypothetical protein